MGAAYQRLLDARARRGGGFLLLIDPERSEKADYLALAEAAADSGVDAILVGTSFMMGGNFGAAMKFIKEVTHLPVIIFPGSYTQITPQADAILFTSLISGRNPQYLIDEQVKGAPFIKAAGLEAIPTGYMLVESGPLTSVQFISGTLPIPRGKPDIAAAHALAAQYMGMKLAYFEAGSGAEKPIPVGMVQMVSRVVDIPLLIGGGLSTPEDCAERVAAGASFIVMGTRIERGSGLTLLRELTAASHPLESVVA
ncbi:geranylgeranylglyceryl/heptaprenylglyceryl phosphate synthase [candidate division GN15 bacterium]|nr:geranylgeranylglyceryl/heptaprenylglyceryl phosphate synthase [candidate division GN15 bacterium]